MNTEMLTQILLNQYFQPPKEKSCNILWNKTDGQYIQIVLIWSLKNLEVGFYV